MEQRIASETIVAKNNGSKIHNWRACLLFSSIVLIGFISSRCAEEPKVEWITIPAGTCQFGEGDSHSIKVNAFEMSATPITNEQFFQFISATGYTTIAEKEGATYFDSRLGWQIDLDRNWIQPQGKNSSIVDKMNHPVVCISYLDALEYCKWTKVRMPTEVEWEYACELEIHSVDNMNILRSANNETKDTFNFTCPVRYFSSTKNGIYGQLGNVWELCEDVSLIKENDSNSTSFKVIKGGSFLCTKEYCHGYQSNARQTIPKNEAFFHVGFRVIRDLK